MKSAIKKADPVITESAFAFGGIEKS